MTQNWLARVPACWLSCGLAGLGQPQWKAGRIPVGKADVHVNLYVPCAQAPWLGHGLGALLGPTLRQLGDIGNGLLNKI